MEVESAPGHPVTRQVILVNGPAGVGKTTVSRRLREVIASSVVIHGDDLRSFAPEDARSFLGPGSTYRVGAALTRAYLESGAGTVVFEYIFQTSSHLELFRKHLTDSVPVHLFTLWAPLSVVLSREAARPGRARLGLRTRECFQQLEQNLADLGVIITPTGLRRTRWPSTSATRSTRTDILRLGALVHEVAPTRVAVGVGASLRDAGAFVLVRFRGPARQEYSDSLWELTEVLPRARLRHAQPCPA